MKQFSYRLRVRWAEVDLQKVVFNGNYLTYFDVAFTEFWRDTGLPNALAQQAEGIELFAKKSVIEYHAPAHFDDELDIAVAPSHLGNSSMRFALTISRGDTVIVTGELVYVYVTVASMQPTALPENYRAVLAQYQ